jgi:hypothetical protein
LRSGKLFPAVAILICLAVLLAACAPSTSPPPAAQPTIQLEELLLTLEEFPRTTVELPEDISSGLAEMILGVQEFTDSRTLAVGSMNGDLLVAELGYLPDRGLLTFDEEISQNLARLLFALSSQMGGGSQPSLIEEDLPYVIEIPPDHMPDDVYWDSTFLRDPGGLIRLDAVAFRRGSLAVYILYVSAPARQPLFDIPQITERLEAKLQPAQ